MAYTLLSIIIFVNNTSFDVTTHIKVFLFNTFTIIFIFCKLLSYLLRQQNQSGAYVLSANVWCATVLVFFRLQ